MPHWRAIYDDKGRIMVAICHNMDLGDAWEHSDEAQYQGKVGFARLPDRDELLRLRSHPLNMTVIDWATVSRRQPPV